MKKIITILFIIMLFITIAQIRNTLALYRAEIAGEYNTLLGVWSVKVNETDLSSGNANMTFEITDDYLHFEDSTYVDGNVVAPGSKGYFDILVDPTNTDVSIRYNIQIDNAAKIKIGEDVYNFPGGIPIEIVSVEDIFIKNEGTADEEIDEETEHINNIDTEEKSISGIIPLSVINNGFKDLIRVSFKWTNNDDLNKIHTMLGNPEIANTLGYSTGNTTIDQALLSSTERPSFIFPVTLELVQYMGEELVEAPITTP